MSRPAEAPTRSQSKWMDMFAVSASAVCLAHCLLLPLLLALLPATSRFLDVPEGVHVGAFMLAIPASAYAMRTGYRHHGIVQPLLLGALGLILLGVGALGGLRLLVETGFTVTGSVLLAVGHLSNWRLRNAASRTGRKEPGAASNVSKCRCR